MLPGTTLSLGSSVKITHLPALQKSVTGSVDENEGSETKNLLHTSPLSIKVLVTTPKAAQQVSPSTLMTSPPAGPTEATSKENPLQLASGIGVSGHGIILDDKALVP